MHASAVDDDLAGARPRVVVGAHRHPVRAGRARSARRSPSASASSRSCARKSALSQTGPTMSQRARRHRRAGAPASTAMPGVVERRAQQVVHRRVDDREVCARRPASGIRRASAARRRRRPGRRPGSNRSSCRARPANSRATSQRVVAYGSIGVLVAVADAESAAQVDVRERDARRPRARSTRSSIFAAASTIRLELGDLRADVAVDAAHRDAAAASAARR